ncbi:MAG TPA: protein-L-isoaspartate(D-aspartate) O-methyltransferase [Candidatus Nanoarchaeia archaeon]|nr:protein-L-isoaspartate O-methyltransferase [uncultured archaeon]
METFEKTRRSFAEKVIKPTGVSPKVLKAFLSVPREKFVLPEYKNQAYSDMALPIKEGQTISQPSLVAIMTHLLNLTGKEIVLEIGTGSGYQAAILSKLSKEVHTVERISSLAAKAGKLFNELGLKNIESYVADGTLGLPKKAPYDAIIVTAGARQLPGALVDQLKVGGRMVIPVHKDGSQKLQLVVKEKTGIKITDIENVAFVPLIGRYSKNNG